MKTWDEMKLERDGTLEPRIDLPPDPEEEDEDEICEWCLEDLEDCYCDGPDEEWDEDDDWEDDEWF